MKRAWFRRCIVYAFILKEDASRGLDPYQVNADSAVYAAPAAPAAPAGPTITGVSQERR